MAACACPWTSANLLDRAAFGATLQSLRSRLGLLPGTRIALVLPDPVARVRVVPRSELAAGPDIGELLRFRLRSSVPFDIREAALDWAPAAADQVLAAAVSRHVLEDYERACHEQGLDPGLVVLSTLALAESPELWSEGDQILVNWEDAYISFLMTRDGQPLLFRSLGEAVSDPARIAQEVATTLLYHRERLAGPGRLARAWLRLGPGVSADAVRWLTEPLGMAPRELSWGSQPSLDPASRALAAALACLRGRAA